MSALDDGLLIGFFSSARLQFACFIYVNKLERNNITACLHNIRIVNRKGFQISAGLLDLQWNMFNLLSLYCGSAYKHDKSLFKAGVLVTVSCNALFFWLTTLYLLAT
jgi:hypothetical protein